MVLTLRYLSKQLKVLPQVFRQQNVLTRFKLLWQHMPNQPILYNRVIFSHSWHSQVVYYTVQVIPRQVVI
ncbi:Uncharacterised protein [Acinetobacter baumannii]|nr:Uncharacterised protein [Acinetobacter baumannii]